MVGEYFGAIHDFEYNIGDKLYEFAIMDYKNFDKLKAIYTQLINLVCTAKESDTMDEKMDCFFKMFQIVRACLEFSPYTHFYTQVLIDIIVKTYNTKTLRSDLLFKSQIGVLIEDSKYYTSEIFRELEEDEYTPEILLVKWTQEIDKVSNKKHNEYMKFFETIRDLLIENLMEKKTDLKETWGISNGFSEVSAIIPSPNMWGENPYKKSGEHTFFLLKGCKDMTGGVGRGFFTEMLKGDLQEIRKTLEAYTAATPIEGEEETSACGVGYSKDKKWNLIVKVTTGNTVKMIKLDRFD